MKRVLLFLSFLISQNLLSSQQDVSAFGSPIPPHSPALKSTFGVHSPLPPAREMQFGKTVFSPKSSPAPHENQSAAHTQTQTLAGNTQDKATHESLAALQAPRMADKLVVLARAGKPNAPRCDFLLPVRYDGNDTKKIKIHNGEISLALWCAIQERIKIVDNVRCSGELCSTMLLKDLKAEDHVVSCRDLPVKKVFRRVRYTLGKSGIAITMNLEYNENDVALIPVKEATYFLKGKPSYCTKAVPKSLFDALKIKPLQSACAVAKNTANFDELVLDIWPLE